MSTISTGAANISQRHGRHFAYFQPEESAKERWIALLLLLCSCLYLSLFFDYTVLNADEGIALQGAQRILAGQVLYRDFFSFVTPGSYYWIALLFRIFGSSILVGRAALILYGGLCSTLTYLLARRVCSRWSALFASYLVTLTCLPFRFAVLHNWDSTLLAYLALYCVVLWLEHEHWLWALGTGWFVALTFLFEQSKGAGLLLGLLAGFCLLRVRGARNDSLGARTLTALALGFSGPFVATFAYFAANRGLTQMLTDWVWPLLHYSAANKLPYGYLVMSTSDRASWFTGSIGLRLALLFAMGPVIVLPVVPIAAFGVLAWFALKPLHAQGNRSRWAYWVLVSSTLCGLLFSTILTKRPDFTHLNYLAPLFYVVVAWILDGLELPSHFWRSARAILAFTLFLSFTAFGITMLLGPLDAHYKLQTANGTVRTKDSGGALQYVRAHVMPGERILVYPYEPLYYYFTGTFSATRFDFLQPGMHTPAQFQEAIRSMEADQPRAVLLETSFSDKFSLTWPNTPLEVVAARDPVADYIWAHYRPCSVLNGNGFWHFVFLVRKDTMCSDREALLQTHAPVRKPD